MHSNPLRGQSAVVWETDYQCFLVHVESELPELCRMSSVISGPSLFHNMDL